MSEFHDNTGHEEFHDSVSESDDNVSLSDPDSDTDAGESGSEEDFVATDRAAEQVYKEQPPDFDADSAHAAHHDQEVEAYLERSRSQAVPARLASLPDFPQADFAQAGDVLDDTQIEPAAFKQHTEADLADNRRNTSANANRDEQEAADSEQPIITGTADYGHSTTMNADTDTELAGEQQSKLSVGNNGHGASATSVFNSESASGQEQPAEVPALTAETQPDAVLPSIQAVSEASDYASAPERMEAVSEASDFASIEPEAESDSAPEPAPEHEAVIETEPEPVSIPEAEPESKTMPESESDAAQPSEAAASFDDADQGDDMDAAGQQPAATRADFAEIQKLLGRAASEGSDASTESHHQEAASAPRAAGQENLAESASVDGASPAEVERAQPQEAETAAQTGNMLQQIHSGAQNAHDGDSAPEDDSTDSAPAVAEPAHVAASVSEATASSSSERPSAGGFARLPSLPVRRGAPSLPARPSTSTGATPPASVSEQQRAESASAAPPAGNGAPSPAKPAAPAAPAPGNGHAEAAAPSGNGSATGASSSTTAVRTPTSSSTPAANPSSTSSNPSNPPSGSTTASVAPEPAGTATSAAVARAPGSANPSIPPRQPAAGNPSSALQPAGNGQAGPAPAAAAADDESAENRELREKVQNFRVLLVQLTTRLGQTTRGSIVQHVNYRLDLAERIRIPQTSGSARRPYGFEAAIRTAEAQEAAHPGQPLPFACTVMVIGMTGVGKSATINSVLDEDEAAPTNAFEPATKSIKVIKGTVAGVRVKFIDTPGLQPSAVNIGSNQRLLNQMHAAFKKHKPDIMLYMDRADIFRTDMADVPLLRAITETFGANMWFNTIVALTHAAAAPPDGNNGPLTYDTYTRTRTQLLQQNIRQASGDGRLLNPVALVENHPACRKNDQGWGILPNQQVWKPHLILLLLSSKLLSETDSLLKIQQNTGAANNQQANALRMLLGGAGRKMPPIPYLIASFIQKKSPRKPPDEERQFKHDSELKDLNVTEKKEEMRRRREYSRMRSDEAKAEAGATQAGVPAPDIPLQPTFDADNNTHRYRYMEPPPDAALCRPVMDPNGFDHDDGMNAFTVEKSTVIRKKGVYVGGAPAYLMSQVHKERDLFSVVSEAEASYYHTHKLVSTASLDGQTVQSDVLYTGKLETRFKNHPKNKTGAGILVSRLKEDGGLPTKGPLVYGGKIMDRFKPTDKVKVILASATVMNKPQGQMPREQAWNHSAETRIKAGDDDKLLVTVGLNNMRYRGKSGYGGNVSTQYAATPGSTVMGNLQLNNERAGKMTMRVSSHDYPKLGFSLLVPTVAYIWGRIRGQD